jgi:hypothetical protein
MNKTIISLTNKFIEKPKYLEQGAGYLAEVFKTTTKNIYAAKDEARKKIHQAETDKLNRKIKEQQDQLNHKYNSKGECEIDGLVKKRIKTLEDLIEACQIDTEIWEVISWECNKWEIGRKEKSVDWTAEKGVSSGKIRDTGKIFVEPLFQVKCKLQKLSAKSTFQKEFKNFLKGYQPQAPVYKPYTPKNGREESILIFPKQDAHFNRVDIKGRNDIYARFRLIEEKTMDILLEASAQHQLDKITYIVGSDQFNSEFTGLTTGGTPQQNLLTYREAFKLICNHEITVIENLLKHTQQLQSSLFRGTMMLMLAGIWSTGWNVIIETAPGSPSPKETPMTPASVNDLRMWASCMTTEPSSMARNWPNAFPLNSGKNGASVSTFTSSAGTSTMSFPWMYRGSNTTGYRPSRLPRVTGNTAVVTSPPVRCKPF